MNKADKIDTAITGKSKNKPVAVSKPNKSYSLIRAIRAEPNYRRTVIRRNKNARKYIKETCEVSGPVKVMPGQLVSFNYFTPKTEEDLQYYDARPLTIFFGVINTKEGKRILGFNIHYYPPRIRYQVLDRIMEIWKPMYLKVWNNGISNSLSHFDYQWLCQQLEGVGLTFGVRMYIPSLTGELMVVPPKEWSKAVFTEGEFRKETREAILKYWSTYRKIHRTK